MTRTHRFLAVILGTLLCPLLAPTAAHAAGHRGPHECARELDCSPAEINQMSMRERIEFVHALTNGPAAQLVGDYEPRWANITGVIDYFADAGLGEPGSWISYVDAGILHGIERGIAIALGRSGDTGGNPGALLWASYLRRLAAGKLTDRAAHDQAWSVAEQASTEYGVYLAERVHGIEPTPAEQGLYRFSDVYRWVLRNRPAPLAGPVTPGRHQQTLFLNWFTDVSNPVPTREGTELAYEYSSLNALGGTLSTAALFHAYAAALWDDFLADTARAHTW